MAEAYTRQAQMCNRQSATNAPNKAHKSACNGAEMRLQLNPCRKQRRQPGTEMNTTNKQARADIERHDGASLWATTRLMYGRNSVVYVVTNHKRPTRREINRALKAAKQLEASNARRA
jgi:hypothetical protein